MPAEKWVITLTAAVYAFAGTPGPSLPAYRVETVAGSAEAGDGLPARQAVLQQAAGVVYDARSGALILSDAAGHRVRRISPAGVITTITGDGTPGYSGDGGAASAAKLNAPYGVTLDIQGNLYIADLGNRVIRRVDPAGRITTWAGGGSLPADDSSEGSRATMVAFDSPRDLAVETDGTLYISDFEGQRIYAVSPSGTLRLHAGTGKPGYGANDIAATRSALRNPAGLWIDPYSGGLLVAEAGAHRIRRILRGIISAYPAGAFGAALYAPTGVATDRGGTLFVADTREGAALKRDARGQITMLSAGGKAVTLDPEGNAYYAGGGMVYRINRDTSEALPVAGGAPAAVTGEAEALRSILNSPSAVAFDKSGDLYVAEERSHRVRRISPAGGIVTVVGSGLPGFSGDGGPAVKAQLRTPRGLALEPGGDLLIADTGNHVIRRVTPQGKITTVAGSGLPGFRGDGGAASAALLNFPEGVAPGEDGGYYIADTGNHRLRRVSREGLITTWAGRGTGPGFSGDGDPAVFAQLSSPSALTLGASGELYFADSGNARIRRIDSRGVITSVAVSLGLTLRGLAVSPAGTLCLSDTERHRVQCLQDARLVTVAGDGTPGFSGDGGAAAAARFQFPAGLAFNAAGVLAVADWGNHRVRTLAPAGDLVLAPPTLEAPLLRVVHAASQTETPLAPGMLATLYGESLGPAAAQAATPAGELLPFRLGGIEVSIDGTLCPLLYVSPAQINFQVPYLLSGAGPLRLEVRHEGAVQASLLLPRAETAPGLFVAGSGPGLLAVHQDGSLNSAANPAPRGSVVVLYATGAGALLPPLREGDTSLTRPLAVPAAPVRAWVGSAAADLLWSGGAPGYPGLLQINVRLPGAFFPAGTHAVQLQIGTAQTVAGPLLYLK